jgi:hypothetical protein
VNNAVDVKENDEHAFGFAIRLSGLFGLCKFGLSVYGSCFLPRALVKSLSESPSQFFRDLQKKHAFFSVFIVGV